MPDRLYFTGDDEADALLAEEPMALLIGFALDQQVTVPTAFAGPLEAEAADRHARRRPDRGDRPRRRSKRRSARSRRSTASRGRWRSASRISPRSSRSATAGGGAALDRGRRRATTCAPGSGSSRLRRDEDQGARLGAREALRRRGGAGARPEPPHARRRRLGGGARSVPGGQARLQGVAEGVRQRVVAYVTRERDGVKELLVFDHRDHPGAGTQVPAGPRRPGRDARGVPAPRAGRGGGLRGRIVRELGRPGVARSATRTTRSRFAPTGTTSRCVGRTKSTERVTTPVSSFSTVGSP